MVKDPIGTKQRWHPYGSLFPQNPLLSYFFLLSLHCRSEKWTITLRRANQLT